jgi:hypothetical protein
MLREAMDLARVLSELHEELDNLDAAILSLERLQQEGRRRGRPPKILAEIKKGRVGNALAAPQPGRVKAASPDQPR